MTEAEDKVSVERLQEKKDLKAKWLEASDPYKQQILFFQDVLRWEKRRIIHFVALFLGIHATLWVLFHADIPVISLISLLGAVFVLLEGILHIGTLSLSMMTPLPVRVEQEGIPDREKWLSIPEMVNLGISGWLFITEKKDKIAEYRSKNPSLFMLLTCTGLLFLALFGSIISLYCILWLIITAILITPGIYTYNIHSRVHTVVEPLVHQIVSVGKETFDKVEGKARAKIQEIKGEKAAVNKKDD